MDRRIPPSRGTRCGFTLIELLVVIAIIGVLVGLLLPAVQASREAARRIHCVNNLKQIGLAFHNHHDQLGFFPTAGWDWNDAPTYLNGTPAVGRDQKAGWGFQVLPYMEANNTWAGNQPGGAAGTSQERALVAVGTMNSVFFCPSRRAPQFVAFSDPAYLNGVSANHALCDYAASNYEGTGVVRRFEPTRMADVTDGTSNTLLVGEKRLNVKDLGRPQDDDDVGYTSGFDLDTMRRTDDRPAPDYRGDGDGESRFGSSHPGRFNALFTDGSVRSIPYTVSPDVFRYLGDKGDGQVFSNAP